MAATAAASAASAATAAARKIVVFGGAGYVGKAICRAAVQNGMEVVSVTRSGVPGSDRPWAAKVTWVAGDALDPSSYDEHLVGSTSVVHSVGILLEKSGYKKALLGNSPSTQDNSQVTYESANRDTAVTAASAAARKGVSSFIYISAAGAPPGIDKRYITTKREAENILSSFTEFRSILLRPGFIYSEESPKTLALALPMLGTDAVQDYIPPLKNFLGSFLKSHDLTVGQPVALHVLASALVQAVRSPEASGIFDSAAIKRLSEEAF